ncbi:MAG: dual specificity protein phosphatase family protein [Elusimicrobiota bacterium]|jgi:hypothetical protein|nr:dual specificity protein phosphatase family protein [Elusimicrobiota bacterium]
MEKGTFMKEIYKNLFIGNDSDCLSKDFRTIHACKTCHQKYLGYKGSLPQSHPSYLIAQTPDYLYLNMVDMEKELLPKFTHPIMKASLDFIESNIKNNRILIHCNQGVSRSSSLALFYLARKRIISTENYQKAKADFTKIYPQTNLGIGIALYLNNNWKDLVVNPIF